jgi:hypothetical protein
MPKGKKRKYSHVMSVRSDIRDIATLVLWFEKLDKAPKSLAELGRLAIQLLADMARGKYKDIETITVEEAFEALEQFGLRSNKLPKRLIDDLQIEAAELEIEAHATAFLESEDMDKIVEEVVEHEQKKTA